MTYAVRVRSKAAHSSDGTQITRQGQWFWVCHEPDGWVEATSSESHQRNILPGDPKAFETKDDAEKFAKRWKGHPWWCVPDGQYEIYEIEPRMILVQSGWKFVGEGPKP